MLRISPDWALGELEIVSDLLDLRSFGNDVVESRVEAPWFSPLAADPVVKLANDLFHRRVAHDARLPPLLRQLYLP